LGFRRYGAVGSPLAAAVLVSGWRVVVVDVAGVVVGAVLDAVEVVAVKADAVDVGVIAVAVGAVVDG